MSVSFYFYAESLSSWRIKKAGRKMGAEKIMNQQLKQRKIVPVWLVVAADQLTIAFKKKEFLIHEATITKKNPE